MVSSLLDRSFSTVNCPLLKFESFLLKRTPSKTRLLRRGGPYDSPATVLNALKVYEEHTKRCIKTFPRYVSSSIECSITVNCKDSMPENLRGFAQEELTSPPRGMVAAVKAGKGRTREGILEAVETLLGKFKLLKLHLKSGAVKPTQTEANESDYGVRVTLRLSEPNKNTLGSGAGAGKRSKKRSKINKDSNTLNVTQPTTPKSEYNDAEKQYIEYLEKKLSRLSTLRPPAENGGSTRPVSGRSGGHRVGSDPSHGFFPGTLHRGRGNVCRKCGLGIEDHAHQFVGGDTMDIEDDTRAWEELEGGTSDEEDEEDARQLSMEQEQQPQQQQQPASPPRPYQGFHVQLAASSSEDEDDEEIGDYSDSGFQVGDELEIRRVAAPPPQDHGARSYAAVDDDEDNGGEATLAPASAAGGAASPKWQWLGGAGAANLDPRFITHSRPTFGPDERFVLRYKNIRDASGLDGAGTTGNSMTTDARFGKIVQLISELQADEDHDSSRQLSVVAAVGSKDQCLYYTSTALQRRQLEPEIRASARAARALFMQGGKQQADDEEEQVCVLPHRVRPRLSQATKLYEFVKNL